MARGLAMALKLTLKPGERLAVNGAVIENGDRRATLTLPARADILREADIMQAAEATSPARRIYFHIQTMILDAAGREKTWRVFKTDIEALAAALLAPAAISQCARVAAEVANGDHYRALKSCRALIDYEDESLSHVA